MPAETIERARKLIEARLRDLEDEAKGLHRALQSLGDKAPAKRSGRPRGKSPRRSKAAKRAPRGRRRQQFLDAVKENPGATPSEIATAIGVKPNQVYALARGLQKDRAIRKSGKGYRLSKKAGA
jgi:hypothetical protein